ncbi:uncharacterized protein [Chelonus insularis]|uniref:uncharacterized protein isoform X2 n=1 Tax=Chelonus insularis TaxID=460826 RepID=UPI0015889B54|nr:uncharacterized protein LOC118067538 isoform X2 [Chelonus insularis]
MSNILVSLISLVVVLQVNSLDVPRLYVFQDLINFSSQLKDIMKNTNFRDPSLTIDNNPIFEIIEAISQINVENQKLNFRHPYEYDAILFLDAIYDLFLTFASDLNSFDDDTISEFIEIVTVKSPEHVSGGLEILDNDEIWEEIIAQDKEAPENCGTRITQQMSMYLMYQQIMIAKLKILAATYGAYNFQASDPSNDSADEFDDVEEAFATALQKNMQQLKELMYNASREVYMCDSVTHVPVNQYEVGKKPQCGYSCPEIESLATERCITNRYGKKLCPSHPCQGTTYDCGWIGGDIDVCEKNASRKRYEWVRSYGNDVRYGQWSPCSDGNYYESRGLYHNFKACSMCLCQCSEELPASKAIRTISLRPQVSDIENNKVVSSVRFVSQDNMIHIQIAEAPLLPAARIDSNQSSWVPLENFIYTTTETTASFTLSDGTALTKDEDFTFVNLNQRTLFMDQITAESDYVLTGVRFSAVKNDNNDLVEAIQLEINITPFDIFTGQLNPTDEKPSQWITAETQPNPSEIYSSERREVTHGGKSYKYDPVVMHATEVMPNKYVVFSASSIFSDAGQSTIPFFDARPIDSDNSLAFNGLGVVFRYADGYAGIIALELFTVDLSALFDLSNDQN